MKKFEENVRKVNKAYQKESMTAAQKAKQEKDNLARQQQLLRSSMNSA